MLGIDMTKEMVMRLMDSMGTKRKVLAIYGDGKVVFAPKDYIEEAQVVGEDVKFVDLGKKTQEEWDKEFGVEGGLRMMEYSRIYSLRCKEGKKEMLKKVGKYLRRNIIEESK